MLVIFGYVLTVFSLFPRDMFSSLADTAFSCLFLRGERVDSIVTVRKNKINHEATLNIKREEIRNIYIYFKKTLKQKVSEI